MNKQIKTTLLSLAITSLLGLSNTANALDVKIDYEIKEFSGGKLNVRSGPGTNYKARRTIRSGTYGIEVIKTRGEWVKIEWDEYSGWINSNYLVKTSNIDPNAEYRIKTAGGTLNVRRGPSKSYRVLRRYANGTSGIKILRLENSDVGYWVRISKGGRIGWVHTKYIELASSNDDMEEETTVDNDTSDTDTTDTDEGTSHSGTYTVVAGDTLFQVMRETGVHWQKLAELNDLEPPYALQVGQELTLE